VKVLQRGGAIEPMEIDAVNDERLLLLSTADNVLVAIRAIERASPLTICGQTIQVAERIPLGFKVAARNITAGEKIFKYGAPIGSATGDISAGSTVHVHNMKSDYLPTYKPEVHIRHDSND
jgi:altronate dehydratase small subunit